MLFSLLFLLYLDPDFQLGLLPPSPKVLSKTQSRHCNDSLDGARTLAQLQEWEGCVEAQHLREIFPSAVTALLPPVSTGNYWSECWSLVKVHSINIRIVPLLSTLLT